MESARGGGRVRTGNREHVEGSESGEERRLRRRCLQTHWLVPVLGM